MQLQGEQLWTIALLYEHSDSFLPNVIKLLTVWDLKCKEVKVILKKFLKCAWVQTVSPPTMMTDGSLDTEEAHWRQTGTQHDLIWHVGGSGWCQILGSDFFANLTHLFRTP